MSWGRRAVYFTQYKSLSETAKAAIERIFKEAVTMINEEADYELEKIKEAKEAL